MERDASVPRRSSQQEEGNEDSEDSEGGEDRELEERRAKERQELQERYAREMKELPDRLPLVSDIIECSFGLLTKLRQYHSKLLTGQEVASIKAKETEFDRANKLIEIIGGRISENLNDYEHFIKALGETGQSHVAYALSSGIIGPDL